MRLDISWEGQSRAGSHKGEKAAVRHAAGAGKVFPSVAGGFSPRHPRGGFLGLQEPFLGVARALLHLPCAAVWCICSLAQGWDDSRTEADTGHKWGPSGLGDLAGGVRGWAGSLYIILKKKQKSLP